MPGKEADKTNPVANAAPGGCSIWTEPSAESIKKWQNDKNAGNQRSNHQSVLKNMHHQKEGGNQNGGNHTCIKYKFDFLALEFVIK